jgi:hypothetical protein
VIDISEGGGAQSRALDLPGFEAQLVFSTFAATQFEGGGTEPFDHCFDQREICENQAERVRSPIVVVS